MYEHLYTLAYYQKNPSISFSHYFKWFPNHPDVSDKIFFLWIEFIILEIGAYLLNVIDHVVVLWLQSTTLH